MGSTHVSGWEPPQSQGDGEFDKFVIRGISFEALKNIKIPDMAEEPGVVLEKDVEEPDVESET